MKKQLLFSLLLSSAFSLTNEVYATEEAVVPSADVNNEIVINKEKILGERPEKKYKAIGLDGKEIEVQFFDKSMHPNLATKKLKLQDGGTYDPTGKQNFPYMAGEKMPEGAAVVYVLRKSDNPDELKLAPADADIGKFSGYTGNEPKEWWMYKDENNYLYPYTEENDPNAKLILNKDANVYVYEVPDFEETMLKQKISKLEEEIKSGNITAAPGQVVSEGNSSTSTIVTDSPFYKKFQFGDGLFNGKRIDFVLTTSDPKATPEVFAKLEKDLLELCSEHPNVAVAIFSLALEDKHHEEKTESLKNIRISYEGIAATLMFSSEVNPIDARAYIEHLKMTSTMSPRDIKELQNKQEQQLEEKEKALEELEEEKRKMEAELLAREEEVQRMEAELIAKEREADIAKEIAAQALDEADKQKSMALQTELELEKSHDEIVQTEEELKLVQQEADLNAQQLEAENEKLKDEKEKLEAENKKVEEKLDDAHEMLSDAHQALITTAIPPVQDSKEEQEVLPPIVSSSNPSLDGNDLVDEMPITEEPKIIQQTDSSGDSSLEKDDLTIGQPSEELADSQLNTTTKVVNEIQPGDLEQSKPTPLAESLAKYVKPEIISNDEKNTEIAG